ncbi:aminoacyl-tRNA hydrolase [Marinihelvus fidelis]|uniref:Peptidyl-tRNA hydrolase n=1 Tax=Marinihelvus fidelis TaxID=2613842 RepID=A0A5N0TBX0_9GAMM|nr:aminoacyl-tRNA hydrolase [Marinihelvus fidelis]KAA9132460.1 aminoacyl-tRNA hydrolase [Marinihelvus fidelis]
MHLVVGLGNPGPKYTETRHNAGFWFLDELLGGSAAGLRTVSRLQAEVLRTRWREHDLILARPTTFMNHSGQPVRALLDYYDIPVTRLLVAYDELDLDPGVARLKSGGGHGGHNGLRDICRHLGDPGFTRLRLGIGHPGHRDAVTGYVLGRPGRDDRCAIDNAISRSIDVLPLVLDGRLQNAMTALHTSAEPAPPARGAS